MTIRHQLSALQWRLRTGVQRIGRAWRYACGVSTTDDGFRLLREAQALTGCYALEELSEGSVLTLAEDRYGEMPELAGLVSRACARVADKWSSSGDIVGAAEDWAMDLIAGYAEVDGIALKDAWTWGDEKAEADEAGAAA